MHWIQDNMRYSDPMGHNNFIIPEMKAALDRVDAWNFKSDQFESASKSTMPAKFIKESQ